MSFQTQTWPVQGPAHPPHAWPAQPAPVQPGPGYAGPYTGPSVSGLPAGAAWPMPAAAPVRTRHPFAKGFACALVMYVVATSLLLIVLLSRAPSNLTAYQVGYVIGQSIACFLIASLLPGLITGLIVRLSSRVWPAWQIALLFLPMFFVIVALQLLAAASG